MKSRSKILVPLVVSGSLVIVGTTNGETYTFIGHQFTGMFPWSVPSNWQGGVIPVSSSETILDLSAQPFGEFINDIEDNFEIGEIIGAQSWPNVNRLSGFPIQVHHAITHMQLRSWNGSLIRLYDVTLTDTLNSPVYNDGWPRSGSALQGVVLDGSITINGGWRIDGLIGTGSIHLNQNASLDYNPNHGDSVNLYSLTGDGWFDIKGTINMVGDSPADFSAGVLDLGRNDQTLGGNQADRVMIYGDAKLGQWMITGSNSNHQLPLDRIDVSGTIDLTNASFHEEAGGFVNFVEPFPDHFVIASYGNRIGLIADETLSMLLYLNWSNPTLIDAPIHYTSGENAGPGEIWVMIPEPAAALTLALMVPIALRRHHQKPT